MDDEREKELVESRIRLGKRLKELRKRCGMNQDKLADLAGINRSYLSNVESGHNSPTLNKLERLAKALGVSLIEFFPGGMIRTRLLGQRFPEAYPKQPEDYPEQRDETVSPEEMLIEEQHIEYDTDTEFEMYPGLHDFLTDEDEMMLTQPTAGEVRHLKGIRFIGNFMPDKRFFRDALLAYRRRGSSNS